MESLLARLPSRSRIAVIRLRSMGDCVLTTPALALLKAYRPDLQVRVVVEPRFAGNLLLLHRSKGARSELTRISTKAGISRQKLTNPTVDSARGARILDPWSPPDYRAPARWACATPIASGLQIAAEGS